MSMLAQDFELALGREQLGLHRFFLRRGLAPADVDDCFQNVAEKLWRQYGKPQVRENFSRYSKRVAEGVFYEFLRQARRSKLQYEPPEYFEECSFPFADLWGRQVPSTRWELAEEFSVAPLERAEIIAQLNPLIPRDYPILSYLSEGASFQEVSEFFGLSISALRYRLNQIGRFIHQRLSPTALQQYRLRQRKAITSPVFALQVQRSHIASYLRNLPGYVPEWILWFRRLSAHSTDTNEPITFGVIQRLARDTGTLNEEQGRRFLLAATSDRAGLLTQKFFEIMPRGEPRLLSFSDISQFLGKENIRDKAGVNDREWMDQIAIAWEPTSKWAELKAWG